MRNFLKYVSQKIIFLIEFYVTNRKYNVKYITRVHILKFHVIFPNLTKYPSLDLQFLERENVQQMVIKYLWQNKARVAIVEAHFCGVVLLVAQISQL